MAGPAAQRISALDYLTEERASETKHEYYAGQVFAMAGASKSHVRVSVNVVSLLQVKLRGGPCEPYNGDMRVHVHRNGLYTYPDASISCGLAEFADSGVDTLLNPKVIFEVMSPSTERYDRGHKFHLYQECPSITDVVLIAQDRMFVEHFRRREGRTWEYQAYSEPEASVRLEDVGAELVLGAIYERVEFPENVSIHPPEA